MTPDVVAAIAISCIGLFFVGLMFFDDDFEYGTRRRRPPKRKMKL